MRNSEVSNIGSNLKYANLKNYNWINEQLQDNSVNYQNYGRPGTRGGRHEMESSFQEKNMNQDLVWDRSYFDRYDAQLFINDI